MPKLKRTERGFKRAAFKDIYGLECSIQESSLATKAAIWVGANEGTHVDGQCLARMHLDRRQARWLGNWLIRFAETGELNDRNRRKR